jgi:RHS repeat-associated protein
MRREIEKQHSHLSNSQRAAVEQILSSRDQITALEGAAGAGKTTSLAAVREAAEREGYHVEGFAPTSRAAQKLAEAGMETSTLQKHLARGEQEQSGRKHLYVLDESSLASSKQMNEFLRRLGEQDRVLLVGDVRQHEAVEAGRPYQHASGTVTNPYQYTGRDYDPETGLRYYRARYYDSTVGRFLSEDPINFGGGINFYSYAANNPAAFTDPGGLAPLSASECVELYKRIMTNIRNLEERIKKYDPVSDGKGGHPYSVGGVVKYTQPGIHYVMIIQIQVRLWLDIGRYQKECGGPKIPCEKFKIINQNVPKPIIVPTPITDTELQLQIESARYMEEFWRDILWGDFLLWVVGTGGAAGAYSGAGAGAGGLVPAVAH